MNSITTVEPADLDAMLDLNSKAAFTLVRQRLR
jgi:hypothetical protein